jgi:hypothetical protein
MPSAAAGPFTPRNLPAGYLPQGRGIASRPRRAIGAAGLSPAELQPCRLLPNPDNRSPIELGWSKNVKLDHKFYRRKALEAEMAHPRRARVRLVWNKQDVTDVYASLFEEGEPYDYMETPRHQWNVMYANKVMAGDRLVGVVVRK